MPNLMLGWQPAGLVAVVLIVGALLGGLWVRRLEQIVPFVREIGIVFALYALWQFAGGLSIMGTSKGIRRGYWIWRHERSWHFPSEATLQHQILSHPLIVQLCNLYYVSMHFGFLIALLIWLFVRHREAYRRVRTTIVLVTTACLLIQLIPVAPPRLIHVGMVDTATMYGQSVYAIGGLGADQYSAMPSVHVAWAAIVGFSVIAVGSSRWRWLILLHTAATIYVVVVTANHYWADGLVAVSLLALSLALQAFCRPRYRRLRGRVESLSDQREATPFSAAGVSR